MFRMKIAVALTVLSISLLHLSSIGQLQARASLGQITASHFQYLPAIFVSREGVEAGSVPHQIGPLKGGSSADDPAIWIHPTDRSRSLLFLSDKDKGIYVFNFGGQLCQHVNFNTPLNNIDVRTGFRFGTELIDIVAGNLRSAGKLAVLKINPGHACSGDVLTVLAGRSSAGNDIQSDSYGFTLYKRPSDGAIFVFDKPKSSTPIKQWRVSGESGTIVTTLVRTFTDVSIGVAEGFAADDELGFVYFAEESKGIHKYNADPDSGQPTRLAFFASGDGISGDREGLALYKCNDGTGYLTLASQGNSQFKVYERQGNNTFVKTFTAADATGTDGLDTSSAVIPLPGGGRLDGFAVIHDGSGSQYYVYDWKDIAGNDLIVCPDGQRGSAPVPTASPRPTATPTQTPEPSATFTMQPPATPTQTPEPNATSTMQPSATATATQTPEPSTTSTMQPSATPTQTPEPSATFTMQPSATPTQTPEPSATFTMQPPATATPTQTPEPSATPSATPTSSPSGGLLPAEAPFYSGGFDIRRIPIELQAWWTPNFGHIHATALVPLGQRVSGVIEFPVRIVLHDNPSHLRLLRVDTDNGWSKQFPLDLDCPYDGRTSTNCAFSVTVSLDTRQMTDGWREIRIRATTTTPDGKDFLNSSGIPLLVDNGGSRSDYNRFCNNTSLIGRGWYEGFGYTNAIIECVPLQPVSGMVTSRVRAQKPSAHLTVALDRSHYIPAALPWPEIPPRTGRILFDQDGDFQSFFPVTIDTRGLENGWHSLSVMSTGPNGGTSQCSYCQGEVNHPAGVAKMWFYVQN